MNYRKYLIRSIFLLISCFAIGGTVNAQEKENIFVKSKQIYDWLREGEFGKVAAQFDTSMLSRVDSAKLSEAWIRMSEKAGRFVKIKDTDIERKNNHDVVNQLSEFEKMDLTFRLVYGMNGKVKGIFFVPAVQKFEFDDPPYYDRSLFFEKKNPLNSGSLRLPAILTQPKEVKNPPVLILVHGSGPNDKDETVGNTKIFRDISVGLAAQGIATLRYDKRTRVYAARMMKDRMNKITVEEEVIEDVIAAIQMVKKDSTLDSTRIFILGHSLGGYLLPRIASQSSDIKGLIMFAANARPVEDMMQEQVEYLYANDSTSRITEEVIDSLRNGRIRVKQLNQSNQNDTTGIMGLPVAYWLDLKDYNPVEAAAKLNLPMLFLHGDRDYQVTSTDFTLWKDGLKHKDNVLFRSYPDANHLFIDGKGISLPAEYNKSGHVSKVVIDDISSFILHGKMKD